MMLGNPIVNTILKTAERLENRVAVEETGGKSISYKKLAIQINTISANLFNEGFKKGDRVLFLVKPGIDSLVMVMAVLQLGGSIVLADPGMGRELFTSRMNLAAPEWTIIDSRLLFIQGNSYIRTFLRKKGWEVPDVSNISGRLISVGGFSSKKNVLSFKSLLKPAYISNYAEITANDEIAVVFTSGTTNLPKGVIHTVSSIQATSDIIGKELGISLEDIFFTNHLFLVLPALSAGAKIVIPQERSFSPERVLTQLDRYKVTKLFGIPHEFQQIVTVCQQKNIKLPPYLAAITLGAAPVFSAFLSKFSEVLSTNTRVYSVYGMSEILPVASVELEEKVLFQGVGDLLGRVLPGVVVEIAGDGEMIITGPNMSCQYLGDEPYKKHFSGDIGSFLPDGRLVLLGRKKDMIIKSNHNIYPTVFESTILGIPGIKNCSLVGVYDYTVQDERIVLVIEKDSLQGETEFRKFLRSALMEGRHSIDTYAQPDEILFMQIPVSGRSQKVNKDVLRKLVGERLLL